MHPLVAGGCWYQAHPCEEHATLLQLQTPAPEEIRQVGERGRGEGGGGGEGKGRGGRQCISASGSNEPKSIHVPGTFVHAMLCRISSLLSVQYNNCVATRVPVGIHFAHSTIVPSCIDTHTRVCVCVCVCVCVQFHPAAGADRWRSQEEHHASLPLRGPCQDHICEQQTPAAIDT